MKCTLLLIPILLLSFAGFGQGTFKTRYTLTNNYLEWDNAVELNDGSIVMVGYNSNPNTGLDDACLQKTNASGNVISSKSHSFFINESYDYDYLYNAIKTSDGGFATSGQGGNYGLLLKYDDNLNLQWNKVFSVGSEYTWIPNMISTPEKGFVLGLYHGSNGNSSEALVKTDSAGVILWQKRYSNYGFVRMSDLQMSADGNYVFIDVYASNKYVVVKTDTAGTVLWSRRIQPDEGYYLQNPRLVCSPTGSIYVSGDNSHSEFNVIINRNAAVSAPILIKLDANGIKLWAKSYALGEHIYYSNRSVSTDNHNNVVMAGQLYNFSTNPSARQSFLYNIDTTGTFLVSKQYGLGARSYVYGLTPLADSGFIATGSTTDSSSDDQAFALRISKTLANCGELIDTSLVASNLSIFFYNIELNPVDAGVIVQSTSTIATTDNTVTAAASCSVLPLQLTSFTAVLAKNKVVNLQWNTSFEQNVHHYDVERSSNLSDFASLQKVAAHNLATVQVYNAVDNKPLSGTSYYRLRSLDNDGKYSLSQIVPVTVTNAGTIVISPNPVTDVMHIQITAASSEEVKLQVIDITGKVLVTQQRSVNKGANTITLPAAFSKGMYILKVTENGTTNAIKFFK